MDDPMRPARGIFHGIVAGCLVWVILIGGLGVVVARCGS